MHESIDHGVRDVGEHRAYDFLENLAGKFVMESELDLACRVRQAQEAPLAV
jgi:hypothetical protein